MKLKVVAIIAARMGASRLPGKVLLPIMGRPVLSWLIERVKRARTVDEIVVATTLNRKDNKIVALANKEGVKVFRGSETDVLGRVLLAAKKYQGEIIVRLTGDNPLTDPIYIDKGVKLFLTGKYDYVANDNVELTMPRGLDVEIFSLKSLEKVSKLTKNPQDREHVTRFFYQHPKMFRLKAFGPPKKMQRPEWRLAVDTRMDIELVRRVFRLLYVKNKDFCYEDIVNLLDIFPSLLLINKVVKHKGVYGGRLGVFDYIPKFRAAIIGCGRVASGYDCDPRLIKVSSHAGAYQTDSRVQLVAACDIDEKARKQFKERWGEVVMYADMNTLFIKERIDMVSITTRPEHHYEAALSAIKGRVKAIFCEKPFTDNPKKAKKIVDLCQRKEIVLMVDYNRRFDFMHRELNKLSKQLGSCIGGIMYYSNGWMNVGSHAVDLVHWFCGPIEKVLTVSSAKNGLDRDLTVVGYLRNGAIMMFLPISPKHFYQIELDTLYKNGRIRILDQGLRAELYKTMVHPEVAAIKQLTPAPTVYENGSYHTLPNALGHLINVLEGKAQLWSSGEQGLMVQEVLFAACNSWKRKKQVRVPMSKGKKEWLS